MGELFRQTRPESTLDWTGERMVPGQTGAIEAEHYHRYLLARELCREKDVLDVASGEGYGSALLAQTARSVVGVELDPASVEHAKSAYRAPNLCYLSGDATRLPLQEQSIDVVVSFETIEHISDHAQFLSEVKRVLRPGGFLFVSTPDVNVYSGPGSASNPFHVREINEAEFRESLLSVFHNVRMVRQRAFSGSAILPDTFASGLGTMSVFEERDAWTFEADRKLLRAPYLLAAASDQSLPCLGVSLYVQRYYAGETRPEVVGELERLRKVEEAELAPLRAEIPALRSELERLRALEEKVREDAPALTKALHDAASVPGLQAELARLHDIENTTLHQSTAVAGLANEAGAAHREAAEYKRANEALQLEVGRQRSELNALREESGNLSAEVEGLRDRASAVQHRHDASISLARQQSLTTQRALQDLLSARKELEASRQAHETCRDEAHHLRQELEASRDEAHHLRLELEASRDEAHHLRLELEASRDEAHHLRQDAERYRSAYEQAADLLIPLRVRRAIPDPLKPAFRALKRALGSRAGRSRVMP